MITWSESALRRIGMTPESADAVLALSGEQSDNEVQAWRVSLDDPTAPRPVIRHTAQAIKDYSRMAADMGYSVRT